MTTDSGSSSDTHSGSADVSQSVVDTFTDLHTDEYVGAERLIDLEQPRVERRDLESVPLTHIDTHTGDRCGYIDEQELLVREVGTERTAEHMSPEEFHRSGRFTQIA